MAAGMVAGMLAVLSQVLGWQGVDVAAAVYRADAFHRYGFRLWDPGWYGGHWTLDYSVLYPALAGTLGVAVVAVASAAVAGAAFEALVGDRLTAVVFAAGLLVPVSIGQFPFLAGSAAALVALVLARRRAPVPALGAAAASSLLSPLAGAFLAMALVAWYLVARRRLPALMAAAAAVPVLTTAVLFPGGGTMPYPAADWLWEVVVAAVVGLVAGRRWPVVAVGSGLLAAAATLSELVSSPVGGNVGRLEDLAALPLLMGMGRARLGRPGRVRLAAGLGLAAAAVPVALSQWTPAWSAITAMPSQPSSHPDFFEPLVAYLRTVDAASPTARVEVVPTASHWESARVAPFVPLARGWERQLDVADNPIFYAGGLTTADYHHWLLANGVRWVAVPHAPLDTAGTQEADLIRTARPAYLQKTWATGDWTVYLVTGSAGIVEGPAVVTQLSPDNMTVTVTGKGPVVVRVRWNPDWRVVSGRGRVSRSSGSWLAIDATPGSDLHIGLALLQS